VTITTRGGPRFEGVVGGTAPEGDVPGVTLKDARDVNVPGAPIKDRQFVAAANIAVWASGPADAKLTPANGDSEHRVSVHAAYTQIVPCTAFKTDIDISFKPPRRERELQAWADDSAGLNLEPGGANSSPGATIGHGDDLTFGAGAVRAGAGAWDQFAANEKLFGVTAAFDEDVYTTKLDRSAPGFKEREQHAQRVANEIMGVRAGAPWVPPQTLTART
jgi:PAB1-binding protein PBP1